MTKLLHITPIPNGTELIDSLRESKSIRYGEKMQKTVEKILESEDKNAMEHKLLEIFPENKHKVLREFFMDHPVCWIDLLRKLHKYRKNDRDDEWYIEEEHIEEIYKTFLIRGRKNDIGKKLRDVLPDAITDNQDLLEFASKQPSLIDSGGYAYTKLPRSTRVKTTPRLIYTGLYQNIDNYTHGNRDEHFRRVFPKLLHYLKDIFGITPNLGFCQNIDQLSKALEKMFDSEKGDNREDGFRVIQAFYAWSGIERIEEMRQEALSIVDKVPSFIKQKTGCNVADIQTIEHDDTTIYFGKITIHGETHDISWRVKGMKSILQKMWSTEEYTNADAIRDMLAMSITWVDGTSDKKKEDIASTLLNLMPDYGYLQKNRGAFSDESLREIHKRAIEKKKMPLYRTSKRGDSTHDNFTNASYSGYTKVGDINVGFEIQFSDEKSMKWKKTDDKRYKPKDAISGFVRGPKFGTPGQIYKLLNARIDINSMKDLGASNINEIMIDLMREGFLLPYVSHDGRAILLSCKGKNDIFERKFPAMELCQEGHKHHEELVRYIGSINPIAY